MPDVRGGFGAEGRGRVAQAIKNAYAVETNRSHCNKFVRAVVLEATNNKIDLGEGSTANDICIMIQKAPWSLIGIGDAASKVAGITAGHDGKLVVAAWLNNATKPDGTKGHGHCAIVVDFTNRTPSISSDDGKEFALGELLANRAVVAQGSLGNPGASKRAVKISAAFGAEKLKSTVFCYVDVA